MPIPTEPIGSIPRTPELIQAFTTKRCDDPSLAPLYGLANTEPGGSAMKRLGIRA